MAESKIPTGTSPEATIGPVSHRLHEALTAFADAMSAQTALKDGVLTARVVGEFSAGKTRLLRELFSDSLPKELFPVSSLERQTRLQLEITYGPSAQLTLIERAADYDLAIELKSLEQFPERNELDDFDPLSHRLRLALPEQHLILPSGDGYGDDSAKRLFLIDTPGWNSDDDALAESEASTLMAGHHNLSLVYVTQANRLDSAVNAKRLQDFLEAFEDADFIERHSLVFVITHSSPQEGDQLRSRAQQLVLKHWEALGREDGELALTVLSVDFGDISVLERQTFHDTFWQALLAPLAERAQRQGLTSSPHHTLDPWTSALRRGAQDWDLSAALKQTHTMVETARQLLAGALKNDEFIAGMNHYRLKGLNTEKSQQKLRDAWWRQLGCTPAALDALETDPALPGADHPLSDWWQNYWLASIRTIVKPTRQFFLAMDRTLEQLNPETENINQILRNSLMPEYLNAESALQSSFVRLIDIVSDNIINLPVERQAATLLTLSMLEARYRDHYIHAQAGA